MGPTDGGSRLDAFLASSLGVSRQAAQRRLRLGLVRLEAGKADVRISTVTRYARALALQVEITLGERG